MGALAIWLFGYSLPRELKIQNQNVAGGKWFWPSTTHLKDRIYYCTACSATSPPALVDGKSRAGGEAPPTDSENRGCHLRPTTCHTLPRPPFCRNTASITAWLAAEPAVWAAREFIPRNLLISTYGAGSRLASCCNCRTSWLLRVPLATNSIEQHSTT